MRKIIISIIIPAIVMLGFCNFSFADDSKVITAAANAWPPFVDPADENEGLSLAIVRAAFKTQGWTVKMEFIPWSRAEALTKQGKIDILPNIWKNKEREKTLTFSNFYAVNTIKFIVKTGHSFEYNGIKSLTGMTVGTVKGYGYGDDFTNPTSFKREDVPDFITNIKKLIAGRIDATPEDEIVAKNSLSKSGVKYQDKIEFLKTPLSSNNLHIATSLKNKRGNIIIAAFNKGLAEIKKSGELAKIYENYGIKIN